MISNKLNEKRAMTLTEVSEYACVSRGIIQYWIDNKLLPFEILPGRGVGNKRFIRIRLDDLNDFLNSHYHKPNKTEKIKKHNDLILLPKN